MNKKTIRDVDFVGKRVLVRVDFNVPMRNPKNNDNKMQVADETRIIAALPTIKYILEQKPKYVMLLSHLGRPDGRVVPKYSIHPVAYVLKNVLPDYEILQAGDVVGKFVDQAVEKAPDNSIILLQNSRFYPGEEANDPEFSAQLASYADIAVNDAFGTAHRAHASNVGIADHLETVAGFLMEKELEILSNTIENAQRPFVGIMGGAKVSDKIKVIDKLLKNVDALLVGGGIGITFLAAQGYDVQNSLVDTDSLDTVRQLLADHGDKIYVPTEVVVASAFDSNADYEIIHIEDGVPDGWQILDIGDETIARFGDVISQAKTVFWNGPVGVFEMKTFAQGTFRIAELLETVTENGGTTIIGGGDSAAAIQKLNLADKMTHISTGGGASLKLVEGKTLPGVEALADA